MPNSGLETGRKISGKNHGVKTGLGLSQMRGGLLGGTSNGSMVRKAMQDPGVLTGTKAPIVYWNAESCTVNSSNNVLSVTNLAIGSAETLAIGSDPNRVAGSVNGGKAAIVFDATDYISTSLVLGNKNEATVIVVARVDGGAGTYLTNFIWSGFDTTGDFTLTSQAGKVRGDLLGNPNSTNSTYDTYPISTTRFYIITHKLRLTAPSGPGSEQEIYVNGALQKSAVATTFTTTSATVFQDAPVYFGGNSGQFSGGNAIAAGVIFDYALNNAEQTRVENYFRWYYGLA